jgi:hypothetical protein
LVITNFGSQPITPNILDLEVYIYIWEINRTKKIFKYFCLEKSCN